MFLGRDLNEWEERTMLNEGIIVNSAAALVKSEMVNQIRRLGRATSDNFEKAVFKALTGHDREEVDWDIEDNQAGYYTWLKSFDQLIEELVQDDFILVETQGNGSDKVLKPAENLPTVDYSQLVYPQS